MSEPALDEQDDLADLAEALHGESTVRPDVLGAVWDEQLRSWVHQRVGPWIVSVTPMLFNDRVYLTHEREYPYSWTAGWCYDKGGAAHFAAAAWDVANEREPAGHKKLAGDNRR